MSVMSVWTYLTNRLITTFYIRRDIMPTLKGNSLPPLFSYYGSKWSLARYYPEPIYDTIIEPFAGAAGYSLMYPRHDVILYDVNPIIVGLWGYLIRSNPSDISSLPAHVDHIDDVKACQEARWLIGFWLSHASVAPKNVLSGRTSWSASIRDRIANSVRYIKHWKVQRLSYTHIPISCTATWFIDPPYQENGHHYTYSSRDIDYNHLGSWCQQLTGQVIVCEMEGANWLPFQVFRSNYSAVVQNSRRRVVKEAVWYNNN